MKKLALLLGAMSIAATAMAGGKEAVPTAGDNTAIREIVKEVVVYKDKQATNGGDIQVLYKWWGQSGEHDHDNGYADKQNFGNRGRLELNANFNLTDKDKLNFRLRSHRPLGSAGYKDSKGAEKYVTKSDDVRFRYWHKHDFLDGMASSRVLYRNANGNMYTTAKADHHLEYHLGFDLKGFLFNNDYVKTTEFELGPSVGYGWQDAGTTNRQDTYYGGIDLLSYFKLPWNFGIRLNVYARYFNTNKAIYDNKKSDIIVTTEAKLYNNTPLWTGDKAKLSFDFEGGFDPYKYSERQVYTQEVVKKSHNENTNYKLYAQPALKFDYKGENGINYFVAAGAWLENIHKTNSENSGYVWMPAAWAGFKKKF